MSGGGGLPPGWSEWKTDAGETYFHHAAANTTQWDRPLAEVADAGEAAEQVYRPSQYDLSASKSAISAPAPVAYGSPTVADPGEEVVSLSKAPGGRISAEEVEDPGAAAADTLSGLQSWALAHAQRLFDVSTEDVVRRLKMSAMPYPFPDEASKVELRDRPDFYGPFWIATTAVLFLAATGNFARILQGDASGTFRADYGLVGVAASIIYGCLLVIPLAVKTCLFFSGEEAGSVELVHMTSVCGYALLPTIPVSMVCLAPHALVRWIAVLAGLAVSLIFTYGHFLRDVNVNAAWLRGVLLAAPCITPVAVFLTYRLHFFAGAVP